MVKQWNVEQSIVGSPLTLKRLFETSENTLPQSCTMPVEADIGPLKSYKPAKLSTLNDRLMRAYYSNCEENFVQIS